MACMRLHSAVIGPDPGHNTVNDGRAAHMLYSLLLRHRCAVHDICWPDGTQHAAILPLRNVGFAI